MEAHAQVLSKTEPIPVLLRARAMGKGGDLLKQQQAGNILLVSGVLHFEDDQAVITAMVMCPANDQQSLNEVIMVGNFGKEGKISESGKSVRRSIAVDKLKRKPDGSWDRDVDWVPIRAYRGKEDTESSLMSRMQRATTGALVQVNGMLTARKNKDEQLYVEVQARKFKNHRNRGGNGTNGTGPKKDAAEGLQVSGYEEEAFHQDDDVPTDW